jgi:hypothetical protein
MNESQDKSVSLNIRMADDKKKKKKKKNRVRALLTF